MNRGSGRKRCRQAAVPVIISFLASALPAVAQEVTVGVRAGMNFSTIRFQDPSAGEHMQLKRGFHLGVSAARRLTGHLEAEAALLYSQGGERGRGGQPWDVAMDYVELPVILRARLPGRISPHVTAGLSPRLQLQCRLVDVAFVGETTCDDPVLGKRWKRLDLAAVGGLGASLTVGPGTLVVEGILGWGLTNLNEDILPPGWAKSADLRLSTVYRLPWR
jgi:hypothetical protein